MSSVPSGPSGPAARAGAGSGGTAGHRIVPHTADLALEAWAPDKGGCIAGAVQALVESFADLGTAVPGESVTIGFDERTDADLLLRVLEEVIYQLDVHGRLPADVRVTVPPDCAAGRAEVRFAAVRAAAAAAVGAVPKAVSRYELRFARRDGQWRCHVTVDI